MKTKDKFVPVPLGCHEDQFVLNVLNLHIKGYSAEQLSFFFQMPLEEIGYILDMHLDMFLDLGSLHYGETNERETNVKCKVE